MISVRDQGAGIPENIRDKIFNLYFTTKTGGSGIGLAMAYRVVQLHHGSVEFTSIMDHGTTFYLRFPLAETAANGDPPVGSKRGFSQQSMKPLRLQFGSRWHSIAGAESAFRLHAQETCAGDAAAAPPATAAPHASAHAAEAKRNPRSRQKRSRHQTAQAASPDQTKPDNAGGQAKQPGEKPSRAQHAPKKIDSAEPAPTRGADFSRPNARGRIARPDFDRPASSERRGKPERDHANSYRKMKRRCGRRSGSSSSRAATPPRKTISARAQPGGESAPAVRRTGQTTIAATSLTLPVDGSQTRCSRFRRAATGLRSIFLRGVADDQTDHRAGQHDLEIVAMLHEGDDPCQKRSHGQTKHNAQRKRVDFAGKYADQHARDNALDRRSENDAHNSIRTAGVNHAVSRPECPKCRPAPDPAQSCSYCSSPP